MCRITWTAEIGSNPTIQTVCHEYLSTNSPSGQQTQRYLVGRSAGQSQELAAIGSARCSSICTLQRV